MTDYLKTVRYQYPEKMPVFLNFLPATWMRYGDALNEIRAKYPLVFGQDCETPVIEYYTPESYKAGKHVDPWGCVWENVKTGYESIVTGHPLPTRERVRAYKAPDVDDGLPHGFLFLRLTDLRGFEEAMIDFAEEPEELQMLIDLVRDHSVQQARKVCAATKGEVVYFGDDNGMQHALPIRPATWRKYLKPAYAAIFAEAHKADKCVYFHTDGCIWEVINDMHEAGADIVNPQIRANGLSNLARTCKGKVPICLDLDRQLFPFATPDEVRAHIMECVETLYLPEGGLMLTAEVGGDVPLENVDMIAKTLSDCVCFRKR